MKFSDLPVGAQFRFYLRGRLLTKTTKRGYTDPGGATHPADPDVEVQPEDEPEPEPAPVPEPAVAPVVVFLKDKPAVVLDGQFSAEDLERILARLRGK